MWRGVLGAVSTGSSLAPAGMAGAGPAVDSRSDHAFVVDDDAIDQRVTLTNAAVTGYSYWGTGVTNNVLRVIDTGAGKQVATFTMPQSISGAFMVDPYTGRLFIVDADQGQLWPVDARHGTLLRTIRLEQSVRTLSIDTGTGHLVAATRSVRANPADNWAWLPPVLRRRLPWLPPAPPALAPSQRILSNTVLTLDPTR